MGPGWFVLSRSFTSLIKIDCPISFFQILRILLGILVLLLILRSLHLLRHRRPFSVVASVLRHSIVDIFALFVSHRTDDVITCKL